MPEISVGPLLRYAGGTDATIWVETDAPCEVTLAVGDRRSSCSTFRVADHHFALVHVEGLEPGSRSEYEVLLDGERRWPEEGSGFPRSVIPLLDEGDPVRIVFGSCRVSAPHEPPYTSSFEEDERGLGVDALYAMAMRLKGNPEDLPHALVLLGDQVYAHKPPFDTAEFISRRRDTGKPPGEVVADFEEYCRLYRDSWMDPAIRWLFSTVPSAMVFDDHEVSDDWNVSEAWVDEMRHHPWWDHQIIGGYASYFVYQHLGNLSPGELADNELYREVLAADDAWPLLRDFAYHTHREPEGRRWSYHRDLGRTRLVVIDSRGGRVLENGDRSMVDDEQWRWIEEQAQGDFDHFLIGTSVPFLLGPGMHGFQTWNEGVASGAWGKRASGWGESIRRAYDLEHWASFRASFEALEGLIQDLATGRRGGAPHSVLILSGDVHHGYLAEADLGDGAAPVYQAVCSPLRNALPGKKSRLQQYAWTTVGEFTGRLLSRLAGVRKDQISWRLTHREPWFANHVATLTLDGPRAEMSFQAAVLDASSEPALEDMYGHRLS
jgi:hypothetical protein